MHKPYENKDELVQDFNKKFPSMKDTLKIIVVEVDERIVFSISMIIDDASAVGHVHDLMLNIQLYNQIGKPE